MQLDVTFQREESDNDEHQYDPLTDAIVGELR